MLEDKKASGWLSLLQGPVSTTVPRRYASREAGSYREAVLGAQRGWGLVRLHSRHATRGQRKRNPSREGVPKIWKGVCMEGAGAEDNTGREVGLLRGNRDERRRWASKCALERLPGRKAGKGSGRLPTVLSPQAHGLHSQQHEEAAPAGAGRSGLCTGLGLAPAQEKSFCLQADLVHK